MSTLKVSAITHPNAASTAFTFNADGSVTTSPASNFPFPAGTALLFQQTTAPTGWTKSTTHNNKALRVVSGAAGSGGTTAFTSVFASRTPSGTVGNTTLTESQIPSHAHVQQTRTGTGISTGNASITGLNAAATGTSTQTTGGGGSHNHGFTGTAMDFDVQYVDVIIATKD